MKIKKYTDGVWTDLDKPVKKYDIYTDEATTLPLTIEASATDAVENYQVYGTSAGAGVETENLFDKDAEATIAGDSEKYTITGLVPGAEYTASTNFVQTGDVASIYYNNGTSALGFVDLEHPRTSIADSNGQVWIAIRYRDDGTAPAIYDKVLSGEIWIMLTKGSTAPTTYIPFGYKIPILNTSGVTENLFDKDATDTNNGYVNRCYIKSNGTLTNPGYSWIVSEYMPVEPNANYTIGIMPRGAEKTYNAFYDVNKELISTFENISAEANTFTTPANAAYIRLSIRTLESETDIYMFVKGNKLPDHYIPHRYESNYDLFVGDSKLYADEYVDYGEQKIYKDISGVLTPTDPPAPLPAIQTYIGENNISVDTTVQPEKVAVKYEGWKGVGDVEKYQNGEWSDNNGT